MDAITLPISLRRRLHPLAARYNKWLLLGLAALLLSPVLLIAAMAGADQSIWDAMREEFAGDPRFWIVAACLPVALLIFWVNWQHERLVMSLTGLEYQSLFRGPLSFLRPLRPDWRLTWTEIESAVLQKAGPVPRTKAYRRRILLETRHGETRKLEPFVWYTLPDRAGLGFRELTRLTDERFLEAVQASPLYRVMVERGLLEESDDRHDEQAASPLADVPGGSFNLVTHPGTLVALAGFVLLAGYGVLDGLMLSPWRFVEWPPAAPIVGAAAVAGTAAALLARAAPDLERWALTGLLAAAAAGAAYPAMQRVNAATDPDGASGYRYRQVAVGRFEPVDRPDMPQLAFDRYPEYWQAQPADGEMQFRLARGDLGVWQLDLTGIRDDQRDWFASRPAR